VFRLLKILLSLVLLASALGAQYQSTEMRRYTIDEGLSDNLINCVLQTRDGFIWVATMNGLDRFDGTSFKNYTHDPSDSLSLSENYVMCLLEDREGNLWVGTWGGGLCLFDRTRERFIRFGHDSPDIHSLNDSYISALCESRRGAIWIGTTRGGLNRLDTRTMEFKHYFDCNITSICEDGSGMLWLGTWDSGPKAHALMSFDPEREVFRSFRHSPTDPKSIASDTVWSVAKDGDSALWLGTYRGVDRFDLRTHAAEHFATKDLAGSVIKQVVVDSKGRIWVGTFNYRGLYLFESETATSPPAVHLRSKKDDRTCLASDCVRWIEEDNCGNLWIGTQDGLNELPKRKQFVQYKYLPDFYSHNVGNVATILEDSRGALWVGYGGGGIDRIDRKSGARVHYGFEHPNARDLDDCDVVTIYEDRKETVWVGTRSGGLSRFDRSTGSFVPFRHDANNDRSIQANWVHQILETTNGKLYVATETGIDEFDRKTQQFKRLQESLRDSMDGNNSWGNQLYEDHNGDLWFSQWLSGVLYYNVRTRRYRHFMPEINNAASISSTKITSFFEDSRGSMWICTYGGGVDKYNPASDSFTRYTSANGLPNDAVFKIEEDRGGDLWISTMKGLARFDPRTETFRTFDVSDGLISNEFMWRSSCRGKDGEMFFGGAGGFISFVPDSIGDNPRAPQVAITSFKVFERELHLPQSLQRTPLITLAHDQNFFSIEFTALDFSDPKHNRYMYRLDGFEKQWNEVGDRTFASYTDVRPGSYQFTVRAANADGIWNNEGALLSVVVAPALWMTWWFRLLAALFLTGLGIALYRYRIHHLLEMQNVRLRIAGDLHDEIGSNLSSIAITSHMMQQDAALSGQQQELLEDIAVTARETADAMRDIVWFINPDHDTPNQTVAKMQEIAQLLLRDIRYTMEIDEAAFSLITSLEARRNIYFIYKEALNNIVKHSRATAAAIRLERKSNGIEFSVSDNGVGFDGTVAHSGNGLRTMSKRAAEMNAAFRLSGTPNGGTAIVVFVKIP